MDNEDNQREHITTDPSGAENVKQNNQVIPPTDSVPSPDSLKAKKSKKILLILLIALVLLIGSLSAWYFLIRADIKEPVGTLQQTSQAVEVEAEETKEYSYTTATKGTNVTFTAPVSWKLESENYSPEEDLTLVTDIYTTNKGNELALFASYGKGGSCDPDSIKFTLVKKIKTQTPLVEFREYSPDSSDPKYSQAGGLYLEDVTLLSKSVQELEEGGSLVGVCENTQAFKTFDGMYVTIKSKKYLNSDTRIPTKYSDISDDTELISALESMKFVKGN